MLVRANLNRPVRTISTEQVDLYLVVWERNRLRLPLLSNDGLAGPQMMPHITQILLDSLYPFEISIFLRDDTPFYVHAQSRILKVSLSPAKPYAIGKTEPSM
jgi:hypothetical protein